VVYVNKANTFPVRDGRTWLTAYQAVQAGIDKAQEKGIHEVWVAGGVYNEKRADASGALVLAKGVSLYAGFAGTESSRVQRDWAANVTVIDGSHARDDQPAYHVVIGADAALDGFTVQGGRGGVSGDPMSAYGAGLYNYGSSPAVNNCVFTDNIGSDGGGMFSFYGSPALTNCVFWNNSASGGTGGGLLNCYATPRLMNCTFAKNTAVTGGGLHNYNSSPVVTNCILWGDEGGALGGDPATVAYSDVEGGYTGNGNIDADPLFGNPGGGSFRLGMGSPCIDAGASDGAPAADILGLSRPQGAGVDMGAYEVDKEGPPNALFTAAPTAGAAPVTVAFKDLSWPGGAAITAWNWDFGDGTTSADRNPTHTYTRTGAFAVSLTITTALGNDTETRPGYITVNAAVHVDVANTSGIEDGLTWATAFSTIQRGVDAAYTSGAGEVWVAEGTYTAAGDAVATMKPGVDLYSGFAGNETSRDQRDAAAHVATIDGQGERRGVVGADNATLDGFTIARGQAHDYGGGMYNLAASPTVTHCVFSENAAQWGGAVFNSGSSATLTQCAFTKNTAAESGYGGALFNSGGASSIADCIFSENQAASGGAICNSGAVAEITRCAFSHNAALEGGAVFNGARSSAAIAGCTFSDNAASAAGGGIYNSRAAALVMDCTFVHNTSNGTGAAIVNDNAAPTIMDCTFSGNTAANDGGAMANINASPAVKTCTFTENAAGRDGGALFCSDGAPTVAGCTFNENTGSAGGAVFTRNTAGEVTTSAFSKNSASQGAGMFNSAESSVAVSDCRFLENAADNNGGGVTNNNASAAFTNCVFSKNTAPWGGGMYNWGVSATPTLINCSFSGNTALYAGGGMRNASAAPAVVNSIFWGDEGGEIAGLEDRAVVVYSDIKDGYAGAGNINADPLFADPASHDLRIGFRSPCIDRGTPGGVPARDLLGVDRPQGAGVDMGAFEVRMYGGPEAMFTAFPTAGLVPLAVDFRDISWAGGATITDRWWDFGDGATSTLEGPLTHLYAQPGKYTVSLTVATSLGSGIAIRTDYVMVNIPMHVDARNTSGIEDGRSWATAFTKIQPAIDAAHAAGRSEVWVAEGVYTDSIDPVVTLRPGVDVLGGFLGYETSNGGLDPANHKSTISGQKVRRCVVGADEVWFQGFVVQDGYAPDYGGGMYNSFVSPSVIACDFVSNTAQWGGGMFNNQASPLIRACAFLENGSPDSVYGGAIFNSGGRPELLACTFNGNQGYLGGAIFNQATTAQIAAASFYYNRATQGGAMYNNANAVPEISECTFRANKAAQGGAILNAAGAAPGLSACAFEENTADSFGGAIMNGADSEPYVTRCNFHENSAPVGGAIANSMAELILVASLMYANTAVIGPAVFNQTSTATITNCTLVDHQSSALVPPVIANQQGSFVRLTNCIVWNPRTRELPNPSAEIEVTYCDVRGGYDGQGNINGDPVFVGFGPYPFALRGVSPCIDAGRNAAAPEFGQAINDILDQGFGWDGDGIGAGTTGDGSDYDIGAYEFVP
jgi:PKD repeat protein